MTNIFCAIDTTDLVRARTLAMEVSQAVPGLKLGLEFFAAQGPEGVKDIRGVAKETKIFLDLKLHDIPNTVAGAARAAVHCNADFLTVHASGGAEMIKAAVKAVAEEAEVTGYVCPKILAVTVLTALDDKDLEAVGQSTPVADQVLRLAKIAQAAGASGIVCSPREITLLRRELGRDMLLVVPGIRPATAGKDDQKRTMTPKEAALAGADWLVIGRPITEASNPVSAAADIASSLAA